MQSAYKCFARVATLLFPLLATTVIAKVRADSPSLSLPPDSFFERFRERDRASAREFYKKHLDVKGLSVAASAEVADEALTQTRSIVAGMLAGRPDILEVMAKEGTRLIIIGKDQVYTDMPEYRNHPNPAYQNERVRGTGGLGVTSFGEENLLCLPLDRYDDESIAVHEFCHTVDAALSRIDRGWRARLAEAYRSAIGKGLWKNSYAASNPGEYWAEIVQSYFDCNRVNNWNHNHIGTRAELMRYDPEGYDLVHATFKLTPETDWRYKPLRRQPSVIAPPERFKVDPYYTKFTYAREFVVLGSKHASDEALLAANDVIRKLFAYRHDILKALIADGVRLVVLGKEEKLADLPEFKDDVADEMKAFARHHDYSPRRKLLVVSEESILPGAKESSLETSELITLFAKALYEVTAKRPADPDFERRRDKQQYELRVKRMDAEFDQRLVKTHEEVVQKGLWKGSPAAKDRGEYWALGLAAYFDAASVTPEGAKHALRTREELREYDVGLFTLVDDTMAYRDKADWRYARP
jgi:hypothetical protein